MAISYHANMEYVKLKTLDGVEFKVSKEDEKWVRLFDWKSHHNSISLKESKFVTLHRIIMRFMIKENIKENMHVDHINRDFRDNTRSNLRLATRSQNIANTSIRSDNTTGSKGVFPKKNTKGKTVYVAHIQMNNKDYYLGEYDTIKEATVIRDTASFLIHKDFAFYSNKKFKPTKTNIERVNNILKFGTRIEKSHTGYVGIGIDNSCNGFRCIMSIQGIKLNLKREQDVNVLAKKRDAVIWACNSNNISLDARMKLNFPDEKPTKELQSWALQLLKEKKII